MSGTVTAKVGPSGPGPASAGMDAHQDRAGGSDEKRIRAIQKKQALGRGLMGRGKKFSPRRDSVRELVEERERGV